jgi:ribosomal protein L37AE/L43A
MTGHKKYRSRREKRKTLKRVTALQADRRAKGLCLDCGQGLTTRAALRLSPEATFVRCDACRTRRAKAAHERRRHTEEGT